MRVSRFTRGAVSNLVFSRCNHGLELVAGSHQKYTSKSQIMPTPEEDTSVFLFFLLLIRCFVLLISDMLRMSSAHAVNLCDYYDDD